MTKYKNKSYVQKYVYPLLVIQLKLNKKIQGKLNGDKKLNNLSKNKIQAALSSSSGENSFQAPWNILIL